jgi:hypothetical protein
MPDCAINQVGEFFSLQKDDLRLLLLEESRQRLNSNEAAPAGSGNRFRPAQNIELAEDAAQM